MKKTLICGLVVTASISFNANAGYFNGLQEMYTNVKVWVSKATKPTKTRW